VAKRAGSSYRAGVSKDWLRIPVSAASAKAKAEPARGRKAAADALPVAISNPRKVYWPEQGYTKGDLVGYYDQVAGFLLPYLRDRPCTCTAGPTGSAESPSIRSSSRRTC